MKDFVDEIVVVDTGSEDRTKEIARKFTHNVYDFQWIDSFAEARNYSLSKATKDWVLVLDADEVLSRVDMARLRDLLDRTEKDAFYLIQRNYTNDHTKPCWVPVDKPVRESKDYAGYARNPIIRLFRNRSELRFSGVVHEVLDESVREGKSQILDIPVHHYCEDKDTDTRQLHYLELCEKALQKGPDGRLYASAAAVHLNVKNDAQTALNYFQKAVECGYKTDLCRENVAECHLKLGQYNEAIALYGALVDEGHGSISLFSNLAYLRVQEGDYEQALEYLNRALAIAGDHYTRDTLQQNIMHTKQRMREN